MKRLRLIQPLSYLSLTLMVLALFLLLRIEVRERQRLELRLILWENSEGVMWRAPTLNDPNKPDTGLNL